MNYEKYDWIDLKSKRNAWVYVGTRSNGQTIRCVVNDDSKALYSVSLVYETLADGYTHKDAAIDLALKELARLGLPYSKENCAVHLTSLKRKGINGNRAVVTAKNTENGAVTLTILYTKYGRQLTGINFDDCKRSFSPEWIG